MNNDLHNDFNNTPDNPPGAGLDAGFKTISDFLTAFAPEVSGRSADAVTPELHQQLTSMAAGELGEEEGRAISREILTNEHAMHTLADMLSTDA
jgi:hypothetical protein